MNALLVDADSSINKRIPFAINWLRSSATRTEQLFFSSILVETKDDDSEVTARDRELEASFRKSVQSLFPEDGIIGEEYKQDNVEKNLTWTIDPIDGTRSFVHGVPFFGTMIGLYSGQQVLFGAIIYPALHELIYAVHGQGCLWENYRLSLYQSCAVSKQADLQQAVIGYSGYEYFEKASVTSLFARLLKEARLMRTWGDCYGYCLLARGKLDLIIEPALHVWDTVPLQLIVEESGGEIVDLKGRKSLPITSVIAGNSRLVDQLKSLQ